MTLDLNKMLKIERDIFLTTILTSSTLGNPIAYKKSFVTNNYWKVERTGNEGEYYYLFHKTYTYKVHLICIILHPILIFESRPQCIRVYTATLMFFHIAIQVEETKKFHSFFRFIIIIGLWLVNRQVFRY